jgi:hypothetical protein
LQAQHLLAVAALHVGRAFGMRDAPAGGHQVHRAGLDFLDVALAVAVHDAAVEQIGDGGKPDMRMRANVHAFAGHELHRAEMVEEDEGADHLPLAMRQCAPHLESIAEVAGARHDDEVERIAGFRIAEDGIVGRLPAHGKLLWICGDHSNNGRVASKHVLRMRKPMIPPLRPGARLMQVDGPVIETERLILRQWRSDDVAANTAMLSDPGFHRG